MSVWQAKVATLFPEMFPGVLGQSLAGRALENGIWSLDVKDIRDHATDRHRTVDAVRRQPAGRFCDRDLCHPDRPDERHARR